MTDSTPGHEKRKNLTIVYIWAGALIILDGYVLSQGVISILVAAIMFFVSLPRAIFFTKAPVQKRYRLRRAGIFIGAAILVFVFTTANNQLAERRAETLVAAVKSFKTKHNRYPDKLNELVPDFIESIPNAKYSLTGNSFYYGSMPQFHFLMYAVMTPFDRRVYDFEKNEWSVLD